MRAGLLAGWLLLAGSAHTLPAVLVAVAAAPLVYVLCVRAGEVR